jgi:hypothetical protein
VAALVIDSQRRELDARVKELDTLVIGQQVDARALRAENATLQKELLRMRDAPPGMQDEVLEWRRKLISDVVDRHYDPAVAVLEADQLSLESQARLQLGLGMMLAAIDRAEDAIAQLSGAKAALEALAEKQPNDSRVRAALADSCEQLSDLYRDAQQAEPAERMATRALEIRKRLAQDQPDDAAARIDMLASHYLYPNLIRELKEIATLSQQVIDEWPADADGLYEAACRLTLRPLLLSTASADAAPTSKQP